MNRRLMFIRILGVLVGISAATSAYAQAEPDFSTGTLVSTQFLKKLTDPAWSLFRAGIINVSASVGMRVTPRGGTLNVEYFRGNKGLLRFSAATQLQTKGSEPFQFEVVRVALDSESCPELPDAVEQFYAYLEVTLSKPIDLAVLPETYTSDIFTVDGTSFQIQIWTGDDEILISPERDINRSLHDASYDLVGIASRCSVEMEGTVEQHSF